MVLSELFPVGCSKSAAWQPETNDRQLYQIRSNSILSHVGMTGITQKYCTETNEGWHELHPKQKIK
jgi:hypothetical protein